MRHGVGRDIMGPDASSGWQGLYASAGAQKVLLEQNNRDLADALNAARAESAHRASEVLELTRQNSKLESDLANEKANSERLTQQFKLLAADILKENSKTFSEGSQKELATLLDPLKTQIKEFREKVEQTQIDSKTGVAELRGLIGALAEQSKQMGEKAENLATALRGSAKTQGDWGEFILRDLLEKAGLREDEQYSFQQNFSGLKAKTAQSLNQRAPTSLFSCPAAATWLSTPKFLSRPTPIT